MTTNPELSRSEAPMLAPEALLAELGVSRPEEIDIEAIAQYCGATVLYKPLTGCEAMILGNAGRAIITVNRSSPRARQRFSAAHELGHWTYDRHTVARECQAAQFLSQWSRMNAEVRANRYAAQLLMPKTLFSQSARDEPMTFETVRKLALLYGTSLTATAIRLVECGSFPAVIVCSKKGQRIWFQRGPYVPDVLWPVRNLSRESAAYALAMGAKPASGPQSLNADAWFDAPHAEDYCVVEDSVRIDDLYTLSLLWWQDERQLLDLDTDENTWPL